ncbi:hypothetical protein J1C56_27355 [Aminobacter anthyllidis]|uniref:Uncharacterized protein n=1 Tax=Aminobacter anthyllidis TaxID=1035067 RepID=A0A9X1AGN3_9HYPH|nr:hypothetical protein [Aminobacter anthyllidis]MBT1159298.1 hypothetical protein [Aminobacter anthyllidis]
MITKSLSSAIGLSIDFRLAATEGDGGREEKNENECVVQAAEISRISERSAGVSLRWFHWQILADH